MNLRALPQIEKDDVLSRFGLQTERSTAAMFAGTLTTFGIGVLVGAGLGLLLAPKSGPALREDIRERLRKAPGDIKAALSSEPPTVEKAASRNTSMNDQA